MVTCDWQIEARSRALLADGSSLLTVRSARTREPSTHSYTSRIEAATYTGQLMVGGHTVVSYTLIPVSFTTFSSLKVFSVSPYYYYYYY